MPNSIIRPPKRALALVAASLGLFAVSAPGAVASTTVKNASQCTQPTLYQPFLSFGDSNWYALPAGETWDNFTGKGWALSGGAKFIQTTLQDGTTGYVLDMPANSSASSPSFCLDRDYPKARAEIADVVGPPNLSFYVTYASSGKTPSWSIPAPPGNVWALSPTFSLYPSSTSGWQLGTFTFVAGANPSEVRVSNFYVDPYAK
jgi:hypothetical protein